MTNQTSHKNFIKRLFGSKVFLFLISLILITLAVNVGRESYRKYQLTQEINRLKLEIERIEGKNEQLANLMEYFKEESYLEKEARLKLNLKKPGEKVVILSKESASDIDAEVSEGGDVLSENDMVNNLNNPETANYWKWWEYFFAP
jgi:cell division protein FtsB